MQNSLGKEKDILRVLQQRPFFSKHFSLKIRQNKENTYRYTIIISKKTLKLATKRNLVKRRIRAFIIKTREQLKNIDFIIVAKKEALGIRGKELHDELYFLFKKANILIK